MVMTTVRLTGNDVRIRDAVQHQLEWRSDLDASAVAIVAQEGIVTLTGYVDTYAGKLAAERAAKSVRGVRAVANEIEVRSKLDRTDVDIARDAVHALQLRGTVPDTVQAVVHDRHVTLTGKVGWLYQKYDAEQAVRHVKGLHGVFNHIEVARGALGRDVRHRIVEALHRNADVDARHISVDITGDRAVLRGAVTTWLQRDAAEQAAANAPGITRVENHIAVEPSEFVDEIC
jgi:osmotically-inducible protein OsmY